MRNATLIATGASAPERIVPNAYFDAYFGEDVDSWLRNHVHIHQRRWCGPDESTADLSERAAVQALSRAGLTAQALDLIIVATDTPEYVSPATSAVLQYRLGAARAGTFDLNSACAGFVTALETGIRFIRSDENYRYVLVVGAYAMSKHLNPDDKKTVTLFADGAGAVILAASGRAGCGWKAGMLQSDGQYHDAMGIYAGGARQPVDAAALEAHAHQLRFVRKFPSSLNPDRWCDMIGQMCRRANISEEEIQRFFLTQININSIWETMDRLGLPRERAHTLMQRYGYTGSACIPMSLNEAWEQEMIREGDTICLVGSGGGAAFAGSLLMI